MRNSCISSASRQTQSVSNFCQKPAAVSASQTAIARGNMILYDMILSFPPSISRLYFIWNSSLCTSSWSSVRSPPPFFSAAETIAAIGSFTAAASVLASA